MKTVLVVSNTTWNIFNFRLRLCQAVKETGSTIIAVGPTDGYEYLLGSSVEAHERHEFHGRSFGVIRFLMSIVRGQRIVRKHDPDVIIAFTLKPNFIYSLVRSGKAKVIANIAGLGMLRGRHRWAAPFFHGVFRFIVNRASVTFVQNPDDHAYLVRLVGDTTKLQLLPGSGVDLERFCRKPRLRQSEMRTFTMAARLLRDKGVSEYVQSARIVHERMAGSVRFLLVGPIEDRDLEAEIRVASDCGSIKYRGKTDDMVALYEETDIFVYPSAYGEGTPRSILEAAAMSIPVITTDNVGCRDAVADGKTGIIVPVRNVDALASAILEMANMPIAQLHRMGEAGRRFVMERFDERIVIQKYRDVISRLG